MLWGWDQCITVLETAGSELFGRMMELLSRFEELVVSCKMAAHSASICAFATCCAVMTFISLPQSTGRGNNTSLTDDGRVCESSGFGGRCPFLLEEDSTVTDSK